MRPFDVLYAITERDLEGVQIEPYFRRALLSFGVGQTNQSVNFSWPRDKALILNRCAYNFNAEPGTTWSFYQLLAAHTTVGIHNLDAAGGTAGIPFHPASATAAGSGGQFGVSLDLLLPAGSSIQFEAVRVGTTAGVACFVDLTGYLIPQGTIARGF